MVEEQVPKSEWKSGFSLEERKAWKHGFSAGLKKMQKDEFFVSYVALADTYSKLSLDDKMRWFRCLDQEGRSELAHILRDWEGQKSDE